MLWVYPFWVDLSFTRRLPLVLSFISRLFFSNLNNSAQIGPSSSSKEDKILNKELIFVLINDTVKLHIKLSYSMDITSIVTLCVCICSEQCAAR